MVELQNKYKLGVRRFGLINWVGATNLFYKECSRFFVVWAQTLLSPLISSLLFLSVLTLALGNERVFGLFIYRVSSTRFNCYGSNQSIF